MINILVCWPASFDPLMLEDEGITVGITGIDVIDWSVPDLSLMLDEDELRTIDFVVVPLMLVGDGRRTFDNIVSGDVVDWSEVTVSMVIVDEERLVDVPMDKDKI